MKNIALVSLANDYSKIVSKKLADVLRMNYIDYNDYFEYEIMQQQLLEQIHGPDLLAKTQKRIAKYLCECENSIITVPRPLLISDACNEVFRKNCLVIFLMLDEEILKAQKKLIFEKMLFKEYNKLCTEQSDIVVEVNTKNMKKIEQDIINKIDKFFK